MPPIRSSWSTAATPSAKNVKSRTPVNGVLDLIGGDGAPGEDAVVDVSAAERGLEIVTEACDVSKAVGDEGFSMKRLASLGVQPPALNNLVANRKQVVNAMRGKIAPAVAV